MHQLFLGLEGICNSCGLTAINNDGIEKVETTKEEKEEEEEKKEGKEEDMEVEQQTLDPERFYLKKPAQGRCFIPSNGNPLRKEEEKRSRTKGFISLESISAYSPVTESSRYSFQNNEFMNHK